MKIYKLIYKWRGCLLLFYCSVIMFSCQSFEQNLTIPTIEADITSNAKLRLSEYFDNFRMIKLPSDTIMGEIERIKYENNCIYISDGRTLFIFSESGELLSCFEKRGNGPGEYSGITDFMIDGENIVVLDRSQQRLITYEHSGKAVATRNLGYNVQAISPIVDNSFFLHCSIDCSHKLLRMRNGQIDSSYLAIDKNQAEYLFVFAHHNFYQDQKSVYFFQPINDTVYVSTEGGSINPFFYVDFKGKNIPSSFLKNKYRDVKNFFDQLHEKPYAYGVYNFAMCDPFLMFCSFYQKNKKLTVFDRKNNSSNTFATVKDDVYFNDLTIPVSEFIYHANKHIVVPLDAFSVVEWKQTHPPVEQFKEMVNATKEGDNPLLLIFDFKQ